MDVEAIQPRVLLCENARVKQCERKSCSFIEADVFIPFEKCDRYNVLEPSVVQLRREVLAPWLKHGCIISLVLNSSEWRLKFSLEEACLP